MNSDEISRYINSRNGELSSDEILKVIDVSCNKDIDHIIYKDGIYNMWDKNGNNFVFAKRNWS